MRKQTGDETRTLCTEDVFPGTGWTLARRCARWAKRDGFCNQHHPETKAAKRAARREGLDEEERYVRQKKFERLSPERERNLYADRLIAIREAAGTGTPDDLRAVWVLAQLALPVDALTFEQAETEREKPRKDAKRP